MQSDETRRKQSEARKRFYSNPDNRQRMSGPNHPQWKGGKNKTGKLGYIKALCSDHPKADKDGCVYEHRLVMEEKLGRYLKDDEVVHHVNEIRNDNRIENLVLMFIGEHHGLHTRARNSSLKSERNKSEEVSHDT